MMKPNLEIDFDRGIALALGCKAPDHTALR
jgi:hypothetical protein